MGVTAGGCLIETSERASGTVRSKHPRTMITKLNVAVCGSRTSPEADTAGPGPAVINGVHRVAVRSSALDPHFFRVIVSLRRRARSHRTSEESFAKPKPLIGP